MHFAAPVKGSGRQRLSSAWEMPAGRSRVPIKPQSYAFENPWVKLIMTPSLNDSGVGRIADTVLRAAIETHAVDLVMSYHKELGYTMTDVGATESYDVLAIQEAEELHIEVMGSTGYRRSRRTYGQRSYSRASRHTNGSRRSGRNLVGSARQWHHPNQRTPPIMAQLATCGEGLDSEPVSIPSAWVAPRALTAAAINGSNRIALRCPRSSDINALTCLSDRY
jgi:hypothetical protein